MGKRVGVVIGRMQGFHNAHEGHIISALNENDIVMVLLGSSNRRVSIKNPFTYEQRCAMIHVNLVARHDVDLRRLAFRPLPDTMTDAEWVANVHQTVAQQANSGDVITLYGSDKDASTYYLKMFPQWHLRLTEATSGFDATTLRKAWFKGYQTDRAIRKTPIMDHVSDWTVMYMNALEFNVNLQDEWDYYQKEAAIFASYPYPETLNFNCGDAVFTWRDHVAFIERAHNPGKGCLALPGGFRNRGEPHVITAVREGYEETRINIPPAALAECYRGEKLFDDGSRSLGIPRSTLAVHFDLTEMFDEKPILYPADDAADYKWIHKLHLDDRATEIYDDHLFIAKHFVG